MVRSLDAIFENQVDLKNRAYDFKKNNRLRIVCSGCSSLSMNEDPSWDYLTINAAVCLVADPTYIFYEFVRPKVDSYSLNSYQLLLDVIRSRSRSLVVSNGSQPGCDPSAMTFDFDHFYFSPFLISGNENQITQTVRALEREARKVGAGYPIIHHAGSLSSACGFACLLEYELIEVWGADFDNKYYFDILDISKMKKAVDIRYLTSLKVSDKKYKSNPESVGHVDAVAHRKAFAEGRHPCDSESVVGRWGHLPLSKFIPVYLGLYEGGDVVWRSFGQLEE